MKKGAPVDKILNRFDGAALLTLRRLSLEELDLLVAWAITYNIGGPECRSGDTPSL